MEETCRESSGLVSEELENGRRLPDGNRAASRPHEIEGIQISAELLSQYHPLGALGLD